VVQGTLKAKTQGVHDLAQSGQAEFDLPLAFNQKPDQPQRPQAKIKGQLNGAVLTHPKYNSAHFILIEIWWTTGHHFANKSIFPVIDKGSHPLKNSMRRHAKYIRNLTGKHVIPMHFDALYSIVFLLFAVTVEDWCIVYS
jgi:hypothetical protein